MIGLPKRVNMAGLNMPQRLGALQEQAELQEAIEFWESAFPLLTRLPAEAINAGRVEAVLREIKSNIVLTRARLLNADLDPWTLMAVRGATDPKLGKRARAVVEAEDKSRSRWAWIKGGVTLAAGIALLFVPGGIFIDAASGAPMGVSGWEEAQVAGRAANTGLHVDDGLMNQGQAAGARFVAVLSTIAAVSAFPPSRRCACFASAVRSPRSAGRCPSWSSPPACASRACSPTSPRWWRG